MASTGKAPRHLTRTPKERLEEKFIKVDSGCWEWAGSINKQSGYGDFHFRRRTYPAHRASWIIHNGEIPTGDDYHGICVLHKCDNRICVNPDHLFLGTNLDNIKDSVSKNRRKGITRRRPIGIFRRKMSLEEKLKRRRIPNDMRNLIKSLHILGVSYPKIQKKTGVHHMTAWNICREKY